MKKIAVILFNLGGPANLKGVKPFLFNLFNDEYIINYPHPIRYLLAKLISNFRVKKAERIYEKLGGSSPILANTKSQAIAIEESLSGSLENTEFKLFISMRYSSPFSEETLKEIEKYDPQELLLIPLYPQFSTTTSLSSFTDFEKKLRKRKANYKIKAICCYPTLDYFIKSHVQLIHKQYEHAVELGKPILLFSAHGLPESIIEDGDPYQWQVEKTTTKIIESLSISDLNWKITYQSKVGPMKWLGPATDQEIIDASAKKLPIIVITISFVSDHSETLVELDIDYKSLALEHGCPGYFRVDSLGIDQLFIKSIKEICIKLAQSNCQKTIDIQSESKYRICPKEFKKCPNNCVLPAFHPTE